MLGGDNISLILSRLKEFSMAVVEVKYEEAVKNNDVKRGENGEWEDEDDTVADRPIVSKKVVHNFDADFYKNHQGAVELDDVVELKVTQKTEETSSVERIEKLEHSLAKALSVIESMNAPKPRGRQARTKVDEKVEETPFL